MRARRGKANLGCLFAALIVAATLYFGVNIGEVYLRFYRYRDAMAQSVRFGARKSDGEIKTTLAIFADSLGLPEAAGKVRVRRAGKRIRVSSEYYEHVELPLMVREVYFNPSAEGPL